MARTRNSNAKDNNMDADFPTLEESLTLSPSRGKRHRKNGTTPTKLAPVTNNTSAKKSDESNAKLAENTAGSTESKKPSITTLTVLTPKKNPSTTKDPEINDPTNNKEVVDLSSAATSLARNLDAALRSTEVEIAAVPPLPPPKSTIKEKSTTPNINSTTDKRALSFSTGTSFTNTTVGTQVKRIVKPTQARAPGDTTQQITTTPISYSSAATKPLPPTNSKSKTTSQKESPPAPVYIDPAPSGIPPREPIPQLHTFVARVILAVPNCNYVPYKVMNLLAYGMSVLKKADPTASYLSMKNPDLQACSIQELPSFQNFFNDWAHFEHVQEDFRRFTLLPGKTKKFRASVLLGCSIDPKKLLSDSFLELDKDLDDNIGGGKVTFEYKLMQAVETDRNWILFGVPGEGTHPEAFANMVRPFLQHTMWKMHDKNPQKYPASKYTGTLPQFVVNVMYNQIVPFKMSEGLPSHAKQLIHFETRTADAEIFKNIFNYITISKADRKMFGQFARFHEAPGPGSSMSQREQLGQMLQNHVAVVRSMAKVALPGIMYPDKIMPCLLANDADGDPRPTVHISLRRIMMKQRIGKPHIWQCILPNASGGWDGFYANGLGCGEHRQRALSWAVCVPAHLRFHLLRKGVLVESMADFINQVFTCESASEAFQAKLINGEVYTYGAASAANMRIDIENSGWIDVALGNTENSDQPLVLSRPKIALKINGDLAAHNFTTNRNPEINDTGSVAYSTSGDTTLGDGDYTIVEDDEVVEIAEHNDDEISYISMDGSTESQLWNPKKSIVDHGKGDGMDIVIESSKNTSNNIDKATQMEGQIAELQRQLQLLKSNNEQLQAAVASQQTAGDSESRPTLNQSEKADAARKGGGGSG